MLFRRKSTVISAGQRAKDCWNSFTACKDGIELKFKALKCFMDVIPEDQTLLTCISELTSANITVNTILHSVLEISMNASRQLKDINMTRFKWAELISSNMQVLRRIILINGNTTDLIEISRNTFEYVMCLIVLTAMY